MRRSILVSIALLASAGCEADRKEPVPSIDREHAAWPIAAPQFDSKADRVTDATTGLVWERAGSEGVRSYGAAEALCSALEGMRLPTLIELQSIVDFAAIGRSIDQDAFPGTGAGIYWTSSHVGEKGRNVIDFASGEVHSESIKRDFAFVRCVGGGKQNPQGFVVEEGVVVDLATGLQWEQIASGPMALDLASEHCQARQTGGFKDWRLPTVRELQSLVRPTDDDFYYDPQIDREAFPGTSRSVAWTSTPAADDADDRWIVDFSGEWSGAVRLSTTEEFFDEAPHVRCVRLP